MILKIFIIAIGYMLASGFVFWLYSFIYDLNDPTFFIGDKFGQIIVAVFWPIALLVWIPLIMIVKSQRHTNNKYKKMVKEKDVEIEFLQIRIKKLKDALGKSIEE